MTIPSLGVYLLIEQDAPAVVVYRRTEQGFARESYQGIDAVLQLPEIAIDLPFAEIYEAIDFIPDLDESEAD